MRRAPVPDPRSDAKRARAALAAPHRTDAVVDLLHHQAALAVDVPGMLAALDYAFAGGGCSDTLARALDGPLPEPSTFEPESFAADLFLDELVSSCMPVELGSWRPVLNHSFLVRVLSHPPSDLRSVALRRGVLDELTSERALRNAFEQLYLRLCELLACFRHTTLTTHYEATRLRIETLITLRDVLAHMSDGFETASSGLQRIAELGREMATREGYRRLCELLELEGDMARADVRVQLGTDGRVRHCAIVRVSENQQNRFFAAPLARLWTKLLMWWRGYRVTEDELVERWLDAMFGGVSYVLPALVQLHGHMEFYLAALAFRDSCRQRGLEVCFPELAEDGGPRAERLFNPLLFAQGIVPAPCELRGSSFETTSIITGPNSGGKTRLLQAIGLVQVLGQAGFYVPAASARIRPVPGLFASLCDKPQADQPEGHLGTELLRIRRLFETSSPGAMVLLDELCSGTNPSEAEEIFTMVLELLRSLRSEVYITTHFLDLAERLAREGQLEGMAFLQAALDEQRKPTYQFAPGVADSSLAAATAERLGVTREQLAELLRQADSDGTATRAAS